MVERRGFEPLTSAVQAPARFTQRRRFRFCGAYCRRRAAGSRPIRPALLQKPGGGQSFGSSPLVVEAKFLPDPGEVVAAYRIARSEGPKAKRPAKVSCRGNSPAAGGSKRKGLASTLSPNHWSARLMARFLSRTKAEIVGKTATGGRRARPRWARPKGED